jgi:hypothetical protein
MVMEDLEKLASTLEKIEKLISENALHLRDKISEEELDCLISETLIMSQKVAMIWEEVNFLISKAESISEKVKKLSPSSTERIQAD